MTLKPIALDTNVLVRFLVDDDREQSREVNELFQVYGAEGVPIHVSLTVLLETEWVLRSAYRRDRASIAHAISALLSIAELSLENEPAVEAALHLNRLNPQVGFADCLHLACAQRIPATLATFDIKASRLPGAALLQDL